MRIGFLLCYVLNLNISYVGSFVSSGYPFHNQSSSIEKVETKTGPIHYIMDAFGRILRYLNKESVKNRAQNNDGDCEESTTQYNKKIGVKMGHSG